MMIIFINAMVIEHHNVWYRLAIKESVQRSLYRSSFEGNHYILNRDIELTTIMTVFLVSAVIQFIIYIYPSWLLLFVLMEKSLSIPPPPTGGTHLLFGYLKTIVVSSEIEPKIRLFFSQKGSIDMRNKTVRSESVPFSDYNILQAFNN